MWWTNQVLSSLLVIVGSYVVRFIDDPSQLLKQVKPHRQLQKSLKWSADCVHVPQPMLRFPGGSTPNVNPQRTRGANYPVFAWESLFLRYWIGFIVLVDFVPCLY